MRDEVRGARCEVRGARCEVRGARCEVRGARCEVRGARCEDEGRTQRGGRAWKLCSYCVGLTGVSLGPVGPFLGAQKTRRAGRKPGSEQAAVSGQRRTAGLHEVRTPCFDGRSRRGCGRGLVERRHLGLGWPEAAVSRFAPHHPEDSAIEASQSAELAGERWIRIVILVPHNKFPSSRHRTPR